MYMAIINTVIRNNFILFISLFRKEKKSRKLILLLLEVCTILLNIGTLFHYGFKRENHLTNLINYSGGFF